MSDDFIRGEPSDERPVTEPSSPLLVAALAGLIGLSPLGCSSDTRSNADSSGNGGSGARSAETGGTSSGGSSAGGGAAGAGSEIYNQIVSQDAGNLTMEQFRELCEARGGYTYVNAACATSAMCKGLSLHDGILWEHSCRGQNASCSGIGCVDMPEDKGTSGQELFEATACGDCHADWSGDEPDHGRFAIFFDPKTISEDQALKRFGDSTDARLESIVVWGVSGFHADNTPFSNMPAYYQKHSLAEIRRVVAHIRTLSPFGYPYGIFGEPEPAGD